MEVKKEKLITISEIILIICLMVLPNLYNSIAYLLSTNLNSENILFGNMLNRQLVSLNYIIWLIIHTLQVLIPVMFIIYIKKENFNDYGFIKTDIKNIIKGLLHILLISIGLLLLFGILVGIILLFLKNIDLIDFKGILSNRKNLQKERPNIIIIILFLIPLILNSINEELVFRSFLFNKFSKLLNNNLLIIIIINLLFASYHIYQGMFGFIGVFILGLSLSINFIKDRNIYTIIIFHTLKNFIAILF